MSISFNQIPVSIRVPGTYVEIDNSRARRGLIGLPTRILVIGQRKAGGGAISQQAQCSARGAGGDVEEFVEVFHGGQSGMRLPRSSTASTTHVDALVNFNARKRSV